MSAFQPKKQTSLVRRGSQRAWAQVLLRCNVRKLRARPATDETAFLRACGEDMVCSTRVAHSISLGRLQWPVQHAL